MKVAGLFMLFAAGATAFMTPAPRTMVSRTPFRRVVGYKRRKHAAYRLYSRHYPSLDAAARLHMHHPITPAHSPRRRPSHSIGISCFVFGVPLWWPFGDCVQGRTKGVATMAISKAIPFLQAPEKLDGSMVGDYGTSFPLSPSLFLHR